MNHTIPYYAGEKSGSSTTKNTKENCAMCKGTPVDSQMNLKDVCDTHFRDRFPYLMNKLACPKCNRKVFEEEPARKKIRKDCCKQYADLLDKSFDEYMTEQNLKNC